MGTNMLFGHKVTVLGQNEAGNRHLSLFYKIYPDKSFLRGNF